MDTVLINLAAKDPDRKLMAILAHENYIIHKQAVDAARMTEEIENYRKMERESKKSKTQR
jgi:hypothetical protein